MTPMRKDVPSVGIGLQIMGGEADGRDGDVVCSTPLTIKDRTPSLSDISSDADSSLEINTREIIGYHSSAVSLYNNSTKGQCWPRKPCVNQENATASRPKALHPRETFHRLSFPSEISLSEKYRWTDKHHHLYKYEISMPNIHQWWYKHIYVKRNQQHIIDKLMKGEIGGIKFISTDIPLQKRKLKQYICKGFPPSLDEGVLIRALGESNIENNKRLMVKGKKTASVIIGWKANNPPPLSVPLLGSNQVCVKIEKMQNTDLKCYNCQQIGHIATNCKNTALCPCCNGNHSLRGCKTKQHQREGNDDISAELPRCGRCNKQGINTWDCECSNTISVGQPTTSNYMIKSTGQSSDDDSQTGSIHKQKNQVANEVNTEQHTGQETNESECNAEVRVMENEYTENYITVSATENDHVKYDKNSDREIVKGQHVIKALCTDNRNEINKINNELQSLNDTISLLRGEILSICDVLKTANKDIREAVAVTLASTETRTHQTLHEIGNTVSLQMVDIKEKLENEKMRSQLILDCMERMSVSENSPNINYRDCGRYSSGYLTTSPKNNRSGHRVTRSVTRIKVTTGTPARGRRGRGK